MEKNFDVFMSELQETNQTLDFFCGLEETLEGSGEDQTSQERATSSVGTP